MIRRNVASGIASLAAVTACVGAPASSSAQVASRIRTAGTPRVQFEFAGRPGVCGDGENFLSTGSRPTYSGAVDIINGSTTQPCTPGPVRVVVDRADDVITGIETVAGPVHNAGGATDIGTVSTRDAVEFLMSIARTTDGRTSREAILPAAIADSVDVTPALVVIARDQNRPVETRRVALSWLARDNASNSSAGTTRATDLLLAIARDENETQAIRRSALNLLASVGHGVGVPALVRIATDDSASWVGEESLRALAQSGDPRARAFLRIEIRHTGLPDATLAVVVRGLAGSEATGRDVTILRNAFATLPGDRARSAIMDAMAQRGTASDAQWLLGIASDASRPLQIRRHALDLAARGTVGSSSALTMYDSMDDPTLKAELIQIYARNNDRASLDKLISIAKTDDNYTLRRRAIESLSRTRDPRARQALVDLTTR